MLTAFAMAQNTAPVGNAWTVAFVNNAHVERSHLLEALKRTARHVGQQQQDKRVHLDAKHSERQQRVKAKELS